jgi:hypothetical protein
VGETYIDPTTIDDTLSLSLGKDPNIVTKRTLLKKDSKDKILNDKIEKTMKYTIEIKNLKATPIEIVVLDQIPITQNGEITIEALALSGGSLEERTGIVEWRFDLKTKDSNINSITNRQFKNLKSLNKDFLYYKTSILDSLNAYENSFLTKIDSYLESKFGKDFFAILRKDFGLTKFDTFRTKIFEDFKLSVGYYLTNKYYNIGESTFGKQSEIRFDDFEVYDYNAMLSEIQRILNNCITFVHYGFKRIEC